MCIHHTIYNNIHHDIKKTLRISAHVLLNLLKELRTSDKMLGLPSILSPFRNSFDK